MATELGVSVGFAADAAGHGVAYAAVENRATLRIPFTIRRLPALRGREVGYAAMAAVVEVLHRRKCSRVALHVEDPWLADDLRSHAPVPGVLTMPYVRLGCLLNRFASYRVEPGDPAARDLAARAQADLALHAAA